MLRLAGTSIVSNFPLTGTTRKSLTVAVTSTKQVFCTVERLAAASQNKNPRSLWREMGIEQSGQCTI
jgi:hypothetical protein